MSLASDPLSPLLAPSLERIPENYGLETISATVIFQS